MSGGTVACGAVACPWVRSRLSRCRLSLCACPSPEWRVRAASSTAYGYLFLRLRNATSYTRVMAWQAHGKLEDHLL